MASPLLRRVGSFLRSPQGQQLIDRGRRELAKPSTRRKLQALLARLSHRR